MSRHGDSQAEVELAESLATRLVEILVASIKMLAGTGEVEAACRLAGQACVALRASDPAAAHRFDALLHKLTRTLTW